MPKWQIIVAACGLAACGGAEWDQTIDPSELDGRWPLSVPSVKIDCDNGLDIWLVVDDTSYQIRGSGGVPPTGRRGYFEEIRLKDPALQAVSPGVLLDASELHALALRRCRLAGAAQYEYP